MEEITITIPLNFYNYILRTVNQDIQTRAGDRDVQDWIRENRDAVINQVKEQFPTTPAGYVAVIRAS